MRHASTGRQEAASAARRSAQWRRLFFAERFARALWHRQSGKRRAPRNPLAQRPRRNPQRRQAQPGHLRQGRRRHRPHPAIRSAQSLQTIKVKLSCLVVAGLQTRSFSLFFFSYFLFSLFFSCPLRSSFFVILFPFFSLHYLSIFFRVSF